MTQLLRDFMSRNDEKRAWCFIVRMNGSQFIGVSYDKGKFAASFIKWVRGCKMILLKTGYVQHHVKFTFVYAALGYTLLWKKNGNRLVPVVVCKISKVS